MQQLLPCANCGAEIPVEARFCRSCGQRAKHLDRPSVTEGTTRILETPEKNAPFNQNVYERPGGLAQATSAIPPQANQTRSLVEQPKGTNRPWVLISSILFIALILTGLFIALSTRSATNVTVTPPVVTRPEAPTIPIPPPPPLPPQGIPQGSRINRAFVYPGAETTMEITDTADGDVLQLRTSDSFDKVADWYINKLNPPKVVKIPGSSVVLEAGEIKVIINADANGTNIMLAQGGD
jgi:zinc-ribbon domain